MAADGDPLFGLRLLLARPEVARATEEVLCDVVDALGPERIDQIRRTGAAVGRLLDAIEARRSAAARTEQRRGK